MAEHGNDPPDPQRPRSLPTRLLGIGARGAQRAASVAGIDETVELVAEEAIVRALESAAVERALVRVLQGPAVQEATEGLLQSDAVERAVLEALDSEMVDRIWERLLSSDEAQKLVERVAQAPEVRAALAYQGVGLLEDVGRQIGKVARRLDDLIERVAWRLAGNRRRTEPAREVGVVTRAIALAVDVGILNGVFFLSSALLALIFSGALAADEGISAPALVLGAGAWTVAGSVYLLSFWSLSGQTPGMRFMGIRLDAEGTRRIGLRRAARRLGGWAMSVITLGVGFLGILLSTHRRGLADRWGGTSVLYAPSRQEAPRPAAE
jgi:uncharacterized RDD family membrane protein YckC